VLQYGFERMVVEFASATMDIDSPMGIDRNHVDICKISDRDAVEYSALVAFISARVAAAHQVHDGGA
jgi:hypothetical protein